MAIEIVDLPTKNGGSFHSYVAVCQRICKMIGSQGCFFFFSVQNSQVFRSKISEPLSYPFLAKNGLCRRPAGL